MEELRTEAGVSAGAMYRYFPSKDELVHAAIETSLIEVEGLIAGIERRQDATGPLDYVRLLLGELTKFRHHTEGVDLFRLAIQGWAYAQSRPQTKAMIQDSVDRQLAVHRKAARRWTGRTKIDAVAMAIAGAVIGYVVQSAFADAEIDSVGYCDGIALVC